MSLSRLKSVLSEHPKARAYVLSILSLPSEDPSIELLTMRAVGCIGGVPNHELVDRVATFKLGMANCDEHLQRDRVKTALKYLHQTFETSSLNAICCDLSLPSSLLKKLSFKMAYNMSFRSLTMFMQTALGRTIFLYIFLPTEFNKVYLKLL